MEKSNVNIFVRQIKGKRSDNFEHSFKSENESSTFEDYVYKLPPPKSKSELGLNINQRVPENLPKDVKTSINFETVSRHSFFLFTFTIIGIILCSICYLVY